MSDASAAVSRPPMLLPSRGGSVFELDHPGAKHAFHLHLGVEVLVLDGHEGAGDLGRGGCDGCGSGLAQQTVDLLDRSFDLIFKLEKINFEIMTTSIDTF